MTPGLDSPLTRARSMTPAMGNAQPRGGGQAAAKDSRQARISLSPQPRASVLVPAKDSSQLRASAVVPAKESPPPNWSCSTPAKGSTQAISSLHSPENGNVRRPLLGLGPKEAARAILDFLRPRKNARHLQPHALTSDSPRSEDPPQFDEIEWDRPIGAGSFGAVYKGTFRGQQVAIKQCKVHDVADREMLLGEIRHLQKLRHNRLVSFLGVVRGPENIIFLLEFMSGGDLHTLLFVKKKDLGGEQKATMALQITEGLSYLHEMQVVHRDLKTMNIVMDRLLNCKICDFGLSITLERTHVTVKTLQGSPRYMAPEQFEHSAKITDKVDIWQMGCIMLELFCNSIPFSHCKGVQQIATELLVHQNGPKIPQRCDIRIHSAIKACLQLHFAKRPSSRQLEEGLDFLIKSIRENGLTDFS